MSEVVFQTIISGSEESLELIDISIPFSTVLVHNLSSLYRKLNNTTKFKESLIRRCFIVLLDPIENDVDKFYQEMEENPQVIAVFYTWNEDLTHSYQQTKLYYVQKEAISLVLTLSYIQFLRHEADKQVKLDQISLSKIYLRKAEKTKEWIMSNLRAEPCHILIIPLNTSSTNVSNTVQRLQKICAKFGYSSIVIHTLDDYLPKSEAYDKLPYGKLIFEYENPKIISRWLRILSPIRLYLYGNEQNISYEWSKELISHETDQVSKRTVNDDDWHTFIENEKITEEIKWNFSARYAQSWKLTRFTPLNVDSLEDNIRFRSALRRSTITFQNRMSTVTAQIFEWYDECVQQGYIQSEFKLIRRDKEIPIDIIKDTQDYSLVPSSNYLQASNMISRTNDDKDTDEYELTSIRNQSIELINYYSNKSDRIYIWLDNDIQSIEQRFQKLIHPNRWKHFSYVDQCQTFILNQQLQYNPRIYLISSYYLAEQLFTYEHVSKIHVTYLYSIKNEVFSKWIDNFPIIQGIYQNIDSLFQQFDIDLTTNVKLTSHHHKQQEDNDQLCVTFFDTDKDHFKRHRAVIDILLKLPRTSDAKKDMIDELRCLSSDNDVFLKQIDDFERNYHSNEAIQWYTRDSCIYRFVNRILRYDDIESIIKYRFFIVDLYQTLDELHKQIIYLNKHSEQTFLTHYRGQLMSTSDIESFKEHVGGFISINTFFSTTLSLDIAFMFAGGLNSDSITSKPVIFSIEVDSFIENTRPYGHINFYSAYEDEDEVLFSLGSVFRIEKVEPLSVNDSIPVIHLKMIDEKELGEENLAIDVPRYIPEQRFLDPIYVLLGVTSLFELNDQREQIKSKLEEYDIQFFDNTDDLDRYTRAIKAIQSFIILYDCQLFQPEYNQQTKLISFSTNDMHFNDLIFELLYEMEHHDQPKENYKDLFQNISDIYQTSNENDFYVQLLLSSSSKTDSEEELRTKILPSSSLITFYKLKTCMYFLQSISESDKLGNAILILQSDDDNIDSILDELKLINSIKYIYLCSKYAYDIQDRRILRGKFQNENDLYGRLCSDNLYYSYSQVNQQIELQKNRTEAKRYLQSTDEYFQLYKEYQIRGKNIID